MINYVIGNSCENCIHKSVCSYKEKYLNFCKLNAIKSHGLDVDFSDCDILSDFIIKCRHYCNDAYANRAITSITSISGNGVGEIFG